MNTRYLLHVISGRKWLKLVLGKSRRKGCCFVNRNGPKSYFCNGGALVMDPGSLLLLSGDVETNPGPTSTGLTTKEGKKVEEELGKILEVLEYLKTGQAEMRARQDTIIERQDTVIERLGIIESEFENLKTDVEGMKAKQALVEQDMGVMKNNIHINYNQGTNLQFGLDRQEQYSRKNSIRIYDVKEEEEEAIEDLCIKLLKEEVGVDVKASDIDIVHRVGRRDPNKPRAIILKFMSHKSKEAVMRKKRDAKNIKIREDLAPGIKRMFDEVSVNRRSLNIESVWTIDGRIRYRHVNSPRTFEIRSYTDYDNLRNGGDQF
ncbi:MAG: hypothetical protein GY817_00375 [bacterium]|nr:hypothetical protein [bacterium]